MKKKLPVMAFILLLIIPGSASALTVLVNSVQDKEFKDLTLNERKILTGIENGVMDILFEQGFIFFSHYQKMDSGIALDTAREADADILLVINPDCETGNIHWQVYKVDGSGLLAEGNIVRLEQSGIEEMSESEFFYFTGGLIGKELVKCAQNL